jgi:hypothetical protein
MDIQTCPYCRIDVVLTPDGVCPSCQRPIRSEPKQPTAAPAASSFTDRSFDFRDSAPPVATSVNPYESPKTYGEYAHRAAPLDRGFAWLLFSFNGRIPRRQPLRLRSDLTGVPSLRNA